MTKRVSDVGKVVTGKTPSSRHPEHFGNHLPFITPSDMDGQRRIQSPERRLSEAGAAALRSRIVERAVAVSCIGWQMGKSVLIETPSVTNQQLNSIVVCEDKADLLFVYYSMLAKRQEIFRRGSGGSRTPILNKTDFEQLELWVPPLPVQRAVARLLGVLDDRIELNRRANRNLGTLAKDLFKSWFVDFDPVTAKREGKRPIGVPVEALDLFPSHFEESELGPIPQGWHLVSLSELAELNARTLSVKNLPPAIHYIEISDVHRGDVDRITSYPRGAEPSRARRALTHGDTVVSAVRPERGAYFLCLDPPEDLVVSTGFVVLTPRSKRWAQVHCAATSDDALDYYERHAEGGAYPAMRPDVVAQFRLALPVVPSLCDAFCSVAEPLLQQAHANRAEMKTLAELRDTLLGPLLSGELTIKTAENAVGAAL